MGRIVAIDYGEKRTGLAVSDPLKMIAVPLVTVFSCEVLFYIEKYVEKNDVELFLLGESRQADYTLSDNMVRVAKFKKDLEKKISQIEIQMADERFTSVLARRAMVEGGLKKKKRQDKASIDKLSAVILLQTYLESLRNCYRGRK